jgi:3-deoxy-manno-octulosonate cytidylyltransferase (CMP-KDO synthetase)
MIEHVFKRASLYSKWAELVLATCDEEIKNFSNGKNIPVIMTSSVHTRALDRVAEAVELINCSVDEEDIIVCVQGDEPMLRPDMIDAVVDPLVLDINKAGTILAMHIVEESVWKNPDTVKVVSNDEGEVLYTSRAEIPYCKGNFSPELNARRIGGIFAFRWKYLKQFTAHPETRLETLESCDSNRVLDMNFRQHIAPYPHRSFYSVDSPEDIEIVEKFMRIDDLFNQYKSQ